MANLYRVTFDFEDAEGLERDIVAPDLETALVAFNESYDVGNGVTVTSVTDEGYVYAVRPDDDEE